MNISLVDRIKKELKTKESKLASLKTKLQALQDKYYETQSQVYQLQEAFEAFSDPKGVLELAKGRTGQAPQWSVEFGTVPSGQVSGGSGTPTPAPVKPKVPQVICSTCSGVNTLYKTERTLSTGKSVPLLVCESCKTERIT